MDRPVAAALVALSLMSCGSSVTTAADSGMPTDVPVVDAPLADRPAVDRPTPDVPTTQRVPLRHRAVATACTAPRAARRHSHAPPIGQSASFTHWS